jgi:WD40 repeat protein
MYLIVFDRFIAIAEQSERGLVSVYDLKTLKKRKVLTTPDCLSKTYVSMEFSSDNQLLLTQGGAPDWTLVCWNWSKGKVIATIKLQNQMTTTTPTIALSPISGDTHPELNNNSNNSNNLSHASNTASSIHNPTNAVQFRHHQLVTQCSFSNVDPSIVCVTGRNMIKFFRVVDSTFRQMPMSRLEVQYQHIQFLCHAWLKQKEDEVIVGTSMGDLLLFQVLWTMIS